MTSHATTGFEPTTQSVGRQRSVRVGTSAVLDSDEAGRSAATMALADHESAGPPQLLVVYASADHDLAALTNGILEFTGDVPLIGCTTAGEIATNGPGEAGVVLFALCGDGFEVSTGMAEIADGDLRRAAAEAARCMDNVGTRASSVLLILSDGLSGDQQEVVRGALEQVGATVPLVGGCAGDDLRMEATQQLFGRRVLTNAIVTAAISSDGPIGIGVRHGWRPVGEPMSITSSSGVVVMTLDDEPALDVYLDRLSAPDDVRTDPTAFTAFAATRPLGLSRRGRDEIRFVATADFENRSITCFAGVAQGGLGWIMDGDAESVLAAADDACGEALDSLGGAEPQGLMVFDCIARKGVLGEGIHGEIDRIATIAGDAPVAGFYTYGEIARTEGASGFHNQTLVVLALG